MLSRRHLRIKILQSSYACILNPTLLNDPLKFLHSTFEKSTELYCYLLGLCLEMKHLDVRQKETEKNKFTPSAKKLQGHNFRFSTNEIIALIEKNETLQKFSDKSHSFWSEDDAVLLNIHHGFKDKFSYFYKETMHYDFTNQQKFLSLFYNRFLYNEKALFEFLERKSIFWNDEIDFWLQMIAKSIKTLTLGADAFPVFQAIKNNSDWAFSNELFLKTITDFKENRKLIEAHLSSNWEYDRLALMDKIILSMAITEITKIRGIPVRSSFNEYIEISKRYSTTKSSKFVNGVLDSIIKKLNRQHKIKIQ